MAMSTHHESTTVLSPELQPAVHAFVTALVETAEFEAFEHADMTLRHDTAAQAALTAFEEKQQGLRMLLMLDAIDEADRRELEHLHSRLMAESSVTAYLEAQAQVRRLAQELADRISDQIQLDVAAACAPGCC
jgi:cell fate (sporulation/competence/biofilm development) regulator YlbF (YheA/YmcA/DUF963 family)